MKFRVVSYNILADSYIRPDRYRHVPPDLLEPNERMLSICSRTAELTADIMCLQEVEERAVDVLQTRFEPEGYESIFHKKGMNRPDGCLTLISRSTFSLEFSKAIYFADGVGGSDSGHVATVLGLSHGNSRFFVVNTHLRWDHERKVALEHVGYREAKELVERINESRNADEPQIICGDFNSTPESSIWGVFSSAGFRDTFSGLDVSTFNAGGRARRIDYIFYRGGLTARPEITGTVIDSTRLPSLTEPSDHIPISVSFEAVSISG